MPHQGLRPLHARTHEMTMAWRKQRNRDRWLSPTGYLIRLGPNPLAPYRVVRPGIPAQTFGGAGTLAGAKTMCDFDNIGRELCK